MQVYKLCWGELCLAVVGGHIGEQDSDPSWGPNA